MLINWKEHATNNKPKENQTELPLLKGILKGVPAKKVKLKLIKRLIMTIQLV